MNLRTRTKTATITSADVRQVMALTSQEIEAICQAAAHASRDFDAEQAIIDCSLFCLNDVVSAIRLQIYISGELVREYAYEIASEQLAAYGPPPDQPPLGAVPQGARIRLVVESNPHQPAEYCQAWFRRLGWIPASQLHMPEGATHQAYGSFVSSGYGVKRLLLANPRYDQPVTQSGGQFAPRGR